MLFRKAVYRGRNETNQAVKDFKRQYALQT